MGLVAFFIGSVPVYWYGCTAVIAILIAFITSWAIFRLNEEKTSVVWDVFILVIPFCFIFSRLFHVLWKLPYYIDMPWRIVDFGSGGFSQYGAVVGFLIAIYLYSCWNDQPVWLLLDLLTVPAVLGLAVMQIGHFFMQLTVGIPLPDPVAYQHTIAEYIEFRYRPSGFENYEYFLPVALYQAMLQIIAAAGLFIVGRFKYRGIVLNDGCIFLSSVVICGLIRFGCGFLYLSTQPGLHTGQIISLIVSLVALLMLYYKFREKVRYY